MVQDSTAHTAAAETRPHWDAVQSLAATTLTTAVLCVLADCVWVLSTAAAGADPLEAQLLRGEALSRSILESQLYALWLLLAVMTPVAAVLALSPVVAQRLGTSPPRVLEALSAPAWWSFLWASTRGGWASTHIQVWQLVLTLVALLALQHVALTWWAARVEPGLRRRPALRAAAYLGMAGVFLLADRRMWPGLYPAAHALSVALCAAAIAVYVWPHARGPRRWVSVPAIAIVLVLTPTIRPADADPVANSYIGNTTLLTRHAQRAVGLVRRALSAPRTTTPERGETFARGFDPLRVGEGRANLVILSVDGLSPWKVQTGSRHDGREATTPFVRQLARDSVVFERHSAPYPMTQWSQKALFTGVAHAEGMRARRMRGPGLLGFVREQGLSSFCAIPFAATISRDIAGPQWQPGDALCDTVVNERNDARVEEAVVAFADAPFDGPRFIYVHLLGTHDPIQAEPRDVSSSGGDGYLAALKTADRRLARIWKHVSAWTGPTHLVVTSDHGHAFGWHGHHGHASSIYEDQIRIPLVLHGFPYAPQRVFAPTSTMDLTALLIGDARAAPLHRALLAAEPPPQLAPVFASFGDTAAVVQGDLKIMVNEVTQGVELYDVAADPREQHNLANERPARMVELRDLLTASFPLTKARPRR